MIAFVPGIGRNMRLPQARRKSTAAVTRVAILRPKLVIICRGTYGCTQAPNRTSVDIVPMRATLW